MEGWRALQRGAPDMNSLVGMGACAAWGVSCVAVRTAQPHIRSEQLHNGLHTCVLPSAARAQTSVDAAFVQSTVLLGIATGSSARAGVVDVL